MWALAVHPSAAVFASGSDDQTIRLWDRKQHVVLRRVSTPHAVRSLAFSSDGAHLAAGMQDGSFTVYDSGLVLFAVYTIPLSALTFENTVMICISQADFDVTLLSAKSSCSNFVFIQTHSMGRIQVKVPQKRNCKNPCIV